MKLGWSTYWRTNRRVPRSFSIIRQGRRWCYHHQGTWYCHALFKLESYRSWTSGYGKLLFPTIFCFPPSNPSPPHSSPFYLSCVWNWFFHSFAYIKFLLIRLMRLIVMETVILTLVSSWQCWQGKFIMTCIHKNQHVNI